MDVLVAAALGPVGSFIAGGRRSRDLWYGSRFLSEATRIAALHLRDRGVNLILPRPTRLDEQYVALQHERPTISNKILGKVGAGRDVATLLRQAEEEARSFLADEMLALLKDDRTRELVVDAAIQAQADAVRQGDFLEFYGAWIPDTGNLATDLKRLFALLDGRKQARLFGAPASSPRVGKSALDAGRDSVLIEIDAVAEPDAARWVDVLQAHAFIQPGERLDAVGLARRRAAFQVPGAELEGLTFPSLARVAIDPWIAGARRRLGPQLNEVVQQLRALDGQRRGRVSPLYFVTTPVRDPAGAREFEYDPEILFESAIPALVRATAEDARRGRPSTVPHGTATDKFRTEGRRANWVFEEARAALTRLAIPIDKLHGECGAPIPYIAIVEADGDGVGRLVQQQVAFDRADHIAQALYDFADAAWPVIRSHQGCAFYAAADELAAYLPVDRALDAASKLSELFEQHLASNRITGTSLSFGLVIAHVKDDLRLLRRRAHTALRAAKRRRARSDLATGQPSGQSHIVIVELPRAGAERSFGGPTQEVVRSHQCWRNLLEDEQLSLALVHDLRGLADRFAIHKRAGDDGGNLGLGLARRMVDHKAERSSQVQASGELKAEAEQWASWRDVREFTSAVLMAERVQRVENQRGEP